MNTLTVKDVSAAVVVDKHNLDEEVLRQPQLMWGATQELAASKKKLAVLERDKANLHAKLDQKLRDEIARTSTKRVTEDGLKMLIRDSDEMRELNQEIIVARYDVDLWEGAVKSLGDRMRSIQEAGDLYRANYFTRESTSSRDSVAQLKNERADQARTVNAGRRRAAGAR